jgi:glycosyltransferase involved in cell wall biosynthesis
VATLKASLEDASSAGTPARPRVSVVVPTRDRPELLARAVGAIVQQDYEGEIESIVVFDQADPVQPLVDPEVTRPIRLLRNTRTPGLAGARNTGILAATGELVAFCDDDDEWLPDKVRRQVRVLEAAPGSDVVATGMSVVYGTRTIDRVSDRERVTHQDLLRSRVQEIHPSSILARRSALVGGPVGLVDEEIPGSYGEDYDWLLRATKIHPIAVVRSCLVRVYWHPTSFFADRWATIIEALQYLLRKYPEFRSQPRGLAQQYGRIAFAHAALGHRREARRWARRTLRVNALERRAYLALAVSTGAISADTLMRLAHRVGRGI